MSPIPIVSVLTPAYNQSATIRACIESVRAQTLADWEMIVVDDGSTDATAEIAASFGDPRIQVIRQENKGLFRLAETYNAALNVARAPLVAILEADDLWPPGKLARQAPDFDRPEVVLSWGRAQMVGSGGEAIDLVPHELPPEDARFNWPVGRALAHLCRHQWLTFAFPVTLVIRTEALRRIGGFRQPPDLPLVDLPTLLALALEGEWAFHEESCGIWRRHEASATASRLPAIIEGAYRLVADFARGEGARAPVSAEEWAEIDEGWRAFQYERCLMLGRMLASGGRRREAAHAFSRAAALAGRARGASLGRAAAMLSGLGLSPEAVFRVAGKPHWREQAFLPGGDPLVDASTKPEHIATHEIGTT